MPVAGIFIRPPKFVGDPSAANHGQLLVHQQQLAVIAYIIGALMVYMVMMCLGELAVQMPETGSFSTYAASAPLNWLETGHD